MNINLTLIGQSITFFVFVWCCMKFIWPPLVEMMRQRQQTIADGLAASERAAADLASAEARVEEELAQAKTQAAEILEQARVRANQMVEEAQGLAREEAEKIKASAQSEIEQETNRARETLRGQVATLAVAGAERILESSIDADAHNAMLDRLAADL